MSGQYVATDEKAFVCGAAIGQYVLVKKASGKVEIAGLADEPIGVLLEESFADGDKRAVRLISCRGTLVCKADAALAEGAIVYGQENGEIDDVSASSAVRIGIALEAATAAGDFIEVVPG